MDEKTIETWLAQRYEWSLEQAVREAYFRGATDGFLAHAYLYPKQREDWFDAVQQWSKGPYDQEEPPPPVNA